MSDYVTVGELRELGFFPIPKNIPDHTTILRSSIQVTTKEKPFGLVLTYTCLAVAPIEAITFTATIAP